MMFRWFNEVGYGGNSSELQQRYKIQLTLFTSFLAQTTWAKG